jgi:hypothetical protein
MRLLSIVLGAAVIMAAPASACSVRGDYRVPANYNLIRDADLVVLARVASGPSAEVLAVSRDSLNHQSVVLEPIRVIKGVLPAVGLKVKGYVSSGGTPFRPHPTPLHRPHPSSLNGACIRQEYAVGALLVAVFRRTDHGWEQEGSPFARSVEDVEGLHGAWVRLAETYAQIALLNTVEERETALRREVQRLLALQDDSAAPAIAADLEDTADFSE